MKPQFVIVLLLLLACGPVPAQTAPNPLEALAPFVGAWTAGEMRVSYEWGVGRRVIKGKSISNGQLVYESLFFYHPQKKSVMAVVVGGNGSVFDDCRFTMKGDTLESEFSVITGELVAPFRQTMQLRDHQNAYHWILYGKEGTEWKVRREATFTRDKPAASSEEATGLACTGAASAALSAEWKDGNVTVRSTNMPVKKQEFEIDLPAPVGQVWHALTTVEGIRRFFPAPNAQIELKPGGVYEIFGGTGNRVLSFVPHELLATRGSAPERFPTVRKVGTWSSYFFTPLDDKTTRVRLTCVGWQAGAEWEAAFDYFLKGNAAWLNLLHRHFSEKPTTNRPEAKPLKRIELEVTVPAARDEVWSAWSTAEGWKAFFGVEAKIEPRPGGPFELYFSSDAPAGARGSEDCKVLCTIPNELFAFDWSAPPQFANVRKERTQVVVRFEALGEKSTRVRLTQLGWGESEEWNQVYAYFQRAWPLVLGQLRKHFTK